MKNELIINSNPNLANISFKCKYETSFGEELFIIGNIEELGSWETSKAIKMKTNKSEYPIWFSTSNFICPVGMEIFYKYITKKQNKLNETITTWEELPNAAPNRHIVITTSGNCTIYDEKNKLFPEITYDSLKYNSPNTQNSPVRNKSEEDLNKNMNHIALSPTFDNDTQKSEIIDSISYDNNQLNVDALNETFLFCMDVSLTKEDRVIITTAHLPFEIDKQSDGSFTFRQTDENLIYSILFNMKEKNICEVKWVGMLSNYKNFTEEELYIISEKLKENNIYMVNVSDIEYKNYWIYINQILSPVFIESSIDIKNEYFLNYEEYFASYQGVNKQFGDLIYNIMQGNELIMINDISLALIPNTLLQKNINSRVGIYFHICFPSSDVIKTFPYNVEILKSVLLCDVIGFHVFNYARNFLTALNRIFGIFPEIKIKGYLTLNYLGRYIIVHIMHAGIDLDYVYSITKKEDYKFYRSKYKKIIADKFSLISIDNTHEPTQLLLKLEAFDLFIANHPEMKNKIILLEIIIYDNTVEKKVNNVINEKYNDIVNKYGKDVIIIEEREKFIVPEQLALFSLCNVLLVLQIWRGVCTLANQFIALQNENKFFGMVISESIGVSTNIKSVIRINPFDSGKIVEAIEKIYSRPFSEIKLDFEKDFEFIKNNSTLTWIMNFFIDLKRITNNQASTEKIGIGINLNYRIMKLNANFKHLNLKNVKTSFIKSQTRLILLDYEETLLQSFDEIDKWEKNSSQENLEPNEQIKNLLTYLSSDSKNIIYLITNREKKYLCEWFKDIPNIGLAAEYGFYYKLPGNDISQFENLYKITDWSWRDTVIKILQGFTEKTEGSYIVEKESIISWIYKDCDIYFGHIQANEIMTNLQNIFEDEKIEIVNGKDYVEIKPKNVNKGYFVSHILQKLYYEGREPDFVLAIGGDTCDEEMFKYLNSIKNQMFGFGKEGKKFFTVTVGKKPSSARYYLKDESEILEYLDCLTAKGDSILLKNDEQELDNK